MSWLARQYSDIKGNFKWALLAPLWTLVVWTAQRLLSMIPHIPSWAIYTTILAASFVVFVSLTTYLNKGTRTQESTQNATNTLLAPTANFDATGYFSTAYVSSLRPELENNLRAAATQNRPNDYEGFYFDLIAIGLPVFMHDFAWAYIFKSQLLLLNELNRGKMSIAKAKEYYDKAAAENPKPYANYSFTQWLEFLKSHVLINIHTKDGMIEATLRGRDFLKYLIHCGRSADDRYN